MLKKPNYLYAPTNLEVPMNINFGEYFLDTLLKHADRTAFIDAITHETISYGEIAQNGMNLAVSLARMGVKSGDSVAICTENRLDFWPTLLGAMLSGASVSPINPMYTRDEIKHTLGICKPKIIFCSPAAHKAHETSIKSFNLIRIAVYQEKIPNTYFFKDLISNKVRREDFLPVEVVGQTATLMILYSSGTTGLPKGVQITHYNGVVCCSIQKAPEGLDPMTVLSVAPWFHTMGLWGTVGNLCNGFTVVYMGKFNEQRYLETIQRYKPGYCAVVPPILVLLAKSQLLQDYDVSSVRMMYTGAASVDLETVREVKRRFPNLMEVFQGYGMTESTLAVARDTVDGGVKPGSVGTMPAGFVVKVVDLETREALGPNKPGEICVKSPTVMKGYIGKNRTEAFDDEGFYRTGDIGYYDEDGFFFIVDRLKELIKYKGYQVPPAQIEAELLKHPAVRDAAVVGRPDKAAGEVPVAFVVRQPGSEVSGEEIQEYVASKVSNPKRLRGGVRFIDEIPKNPSGKILRRILKDRLKTEKSKL
ncbi:unnamed protein product [Plutella xylostella]|uniref:(diamondback moth) hypothetical protein n=1 Tax=Plutella xylostella TaxID=51655 RepID=A0A8S4G5G3_PLUXY|nr:unnamed protein product [Plutella xylostella]